MAVLRDVAEMTKPGITFSVVFTAAMGLWLAQGTLGLSRTILFLATTGLLVGSANILNCWIEREVDGLMFRTRNRPLPTRRLDPWSAMAAAIVMAAVSLPVLSLVTNRMTALLGLASLVIYVLVYTPLKRVTPRALEVGAVPGAIPPLMGWAAATGSLEAPAWTLFAIMFFWQLPHFIAIAIHHKEDFARGGIRVLPVASGNLVAGRYLFAYTLLLFLASLAPSLLGFTGPVYLITALVLGAVFLWLSAGGLRKKPHPFWARRTFLYSLIYLAVLFSVLLLDAS